MPERLLVRVNDELVLDAGTTEVVRGQHADELLVRPPQTSMFHQVVAYLESRPDPPRRTAGAQTGMQGLAAAAVVLRWGSYLGVLLDGDKPVTPAAQIRGTSRISDEEMARINMEASAAMAQWIDLSRARSQDGGFARLEDRALAYLPMPVKAARPKMARWVLLAQPETASMVSAANDSDEVSRVRQDAELHPSRLLANALVNIAWRNGPVEEVHAGLEARYRITERRATPTEERLILRQAADALEAGMAVCTEFLCERPLRPWPEQVLPFGLVPLWLVTPKGWSLTDTSREVRLPT